MYTRISGVAGILLILAGLFFLANNRIIAQPAGFVPFRDATTINKIKALQRQSKLDQAYQKLDGEKSGPALTLPFFDDFSYDRSYPSEVLWENPQAIYVNDRYSFKPVTKGFATFDNYDGSGVKYEEEQNGSLLLYQVMDVLTSNAIDLSGYDASDNVYLNFYYQPMGNYWYPSTFGLCVSEETSQLRLEFYSCINGECTWKEVHRFLSDNYHTEVPCPETQGVTFHPGMIAESDFYYYSVYIDQEEFLHPDFKFRFKFKSKYDSRQLGYYNSVFNIDYVTLDAYTTPPSSSTNSADIGFKEINNSVFGPYTTLPWEQFNGNEAFFLNPQGKVTARNMDDEVRGFSFPHFDMETNYNTIYHSNFANFSNHNLNPMVNSEFEHNIDFAAITFPTDPVDFIRGRYSYSEGGGDSDILTNNEISSEIVFDDVLSYDDGSEEAFCLPDRALALSFTVPESIDIYGVEVQIGASNQSYEGDFEVRIYQNLPDAFTVDHPLIAQTTSHYPQPGSSITIPLIANDLNNQTVTIPGNTTFYVVVYVNNAFNSSDPFILALDNSNDQVSKMYFSDDATSWKSVYEISETSEIGEINIMELSRHGLYYPTIRNILRFTPMIRVITSKEKLEENTENNFKIDFDIPKTVLCPGEEYPVNPVITPSSDECDDILLMSITSFSTQQVVYNEATQDFRHPNVNGSYFLTAPLEPGVYDLVLEVSNSCGYGFATAQIEVLPSLVYEEDLLVCNNIPESSPVNIEDGVYGGGKVRSGETECGQLPKVSSGSDVSFIADDNVALYPGFLAESGSNFLASIGTSLYPCLEKKEGLRTNSSDQQVAYETYRQSDIQSSSDHQDDGIQLYPNPTSGIITLSYTVTTPLNQKVEIRLRDVVGKKLRGTITKDINGIGTYTQELSLQDLPSGIYFCEILLGQERYSRKIIKVN